MRCSAAIRVAVVALFPLLSSCRYDVGSSRDTQSEASSSPAVSAVRLSFSVGNGSSNGTGGTGKWKHKGGGHRTSSHHRHTKTGLNVGMLVPKTSFGVRGYLRAINDAVHGINKAYKKNHTMNFSKQYDFEAPNVRYRMMSLTPSPTGRYHVR